MLLIQNNAEAKMGNEKITFDYFIRLAFKVLIVIAVIVAVNYLSKVLLPFFIAWLFAYLLYPVVKFVQFRMHIPTRPMSIIVTLTIVVAIISLIFFLIIPPMAEQFGKLGSILTKYVQDSTNTSDFISIRDWVVDHQHELQRYLNQEEVLDAVKEAMPGLFKMLGKTANIVISIAASLITLLYMFFILLDYEHLSTSWIKIFPKSTRPFWHELMGDVERELNNYIRGQSLVALSMGVLFCIGFTIIDFPMAIGLGILIGIMDLVPYLHTFALIPTAFLALLKAADTGQSFWIIMASAVAVFCIVQVLIDMVITPKIMGKAMGLNPAILLLSLSVWGALLGFIGLIVALPLTTLLITYYQKYVTKENEDIVLQENNPDESNSKEDNTKE